MSSSVLGPSANSAAAVARSSALHFVHCRRLLALSLGLTLTLAVGPVVAQPAASASEPVTVPAVAAPTEPVAAPLEPRTSELTAEPRVPHLRWWWRHSTPVPIVFYAPENQLGLGAGIMTTWQQPGAWADRPSSVILYGIYTTRAQTIAGASHELHFADDRHVLLQELRYIDWPDRFYGFGNDTRTRDREDYTDHYLQLESEYRLRAVSRLYVGVRDLVRASDTLDLERDGRLSRERPRGVGSLLWSGLGPVLLWDSREGLFWPEGGSLLRADATFYARALGAAFDAQVYRLDLRHYQRLWLRHVLALHWVTSLAGGDLPFQLLPALGGNLLFRGWFLGRLRDRALLAAEAEYRVPIGARWALVSFGSVGRVALSLGELDPQALKAAGGAGVRFAVRPESRANFRLDLAYGDDLSVYFQFREAF